MPALGILGLVALAIAIALAFLAPRDLAATPPDKQATPTATAKPAPPPPLPPRPERNRGASCYDQAMERTTADFLCPRDGTRTQYTVDTPIGNVVDGLPNLRRAAQLLPGISASIDDSEFCRKCTPTPPESPQPILVVKQADGTERRTRGVSSQDVVALNAFLVERRKTPDKAEPPRVSELLGTPAPKTGK